MRILIAEDDPKLLKSLVHILKLNHYAVDGVDMSVIWVHISNIRKKLDAIGAPVSIKFIRNAGYILEATA